MEISPFMFAEKYSNRNVPRRSGMLCCWGLAPGGSTHILQWTDVAFDEGKDILTMRFTGSYALQVYQPGLVEEEVAAFKISRAARVYLEWYDLPKGSNRRRLLFCDFTCSGDEVTGKNNIHWSFIDNTSLSTTHPAVIFSFV